MKKKNVLVVGFWMSEESRYQNENVDYICLCEYHSRLQKHIFRWALILGLERWVLQKEFLGAGIDISQYTLIVLNETGRWQEKFVKYIRESNNQAQLIYLMWNSVLREKLSKSKCKKFESFVESQKKYKFIISTFDRGDSEKYGFLYNAQFIPGG